MINKGQAVMDGNGNVSIPQNEPQQMQEDQNAQNHPSDLLHDSM